MELTELCKNAKEASAQVAILGTNEKNEALRAVAEALVAHAGEIIAANEKDLEQKSFPHPLFKELSLKQWIPFVGLHEKRHLLQIEELKSKL